KEPTMPRSLSLSRCALRALLAAIALPASALAQAPGPTHAPPAAAWSPPPPPPPLAPLPLRGPFDSTVRFELYNRLRGELVDWFATPPDGPMSDFRYNFIGNKLQLGVRWTRDPYEVFVQFQNSTLGDVPDHGV